MDGIALRLSEAQMSCIYPPIGRPMIAKDVRSLQRVLRHAARPFGPILDALERTGDIALRLGRDTGVVRRVISLAWPSSTWFTRTSVSASRRRVAKLIPSECSVAGFLIPTIAFAEANAPFHEQGDTGATQF